MNLVQFHYVSCIMLSLPVSHLGIHTPHEARGSPFGPQDLTSADAVDTHTQCRHTNTQQTPCRWHDKALGVDVKTPRWAMKNTVMWLDAFLQGTAATL